MADLRLDQLRPYFSLVLCRASKTKQTPPTADDIVDELVSALKLDGPDSPRTTQGHVRNRRYGKLTTSTLHYREVKRPAWLTEDDHAIEDVTHHLVVACRKNDLYAVYASDPRARDALHALLTRDHARAVLALERIPAKVMTDVFLGGAIRTLWMNGVHRRTAVKADAKILSGSDLRSALNPLDDQCYHAPAARALSTALGDERPVGMSQSRSSVWVAPSPDWATFAAQVERVFGQIERSTAKPAAGPHPIPCVAVPVADITSLTQPFDLSLTPPELLADDPSRIAPDTLALAEKWAYRAKFDQVRSDGTQIVAAASLDGVSLGSVSITLQVHDPTRTSVQVIGTPTATGNQADLDELLSCLRNPEWLTLRFDSGHVLSNGTVLAMRFRDQAFGNWLFAELPKGIELGQEKPTLPGKPQSFAIDAIGKQASLFCWVAKHWFSTPALGSNKGWLVCDDGSMEVADFVHLEERGGKAGRPRLSLIHVKGAGGNAGSRGISVSDYEIVCGQAVKNLRWIDRQNLADLLEAGNHKDVARAVWKDGRLTGRREPLIERLRELGNNYDRRVVVFQPRVVRKTRDKAQSAIDKGLATREANQMRQLNTLLLGVEADCRAVGAEFSVLSFDA